MTITPTDTRVHIWDIWVRLTHLSYPLFLLALWWTADNREFWLHIPIAIAFSAFITFRVAWGFLGTRTAQFKNFIRRPRAMIAYAKSLITNSETPTTTGHNPLGGLSVLILLALMIAQISTGLFAIDTDGMNSGALSQFVDFKTGRKFGDYHELTFNILLGMVALHLVAIAAYAALKRQNLITPMVTGQSTKPDMTGAPSNSRSNGGRVALSLLAAIAVAGTIGWLQYF